MQTVQCYLKSSDRYALFRRFVVILRVVVLSVSDTACKMFQSPLDSISLLVVEKSLMLLGKVRVISEKL